MAAVKVVIDVGCMTYPGYPEDESMLTLIDRFRPEFYFGYDPHPAQDEYDGFAGQWIPQAATCVRRMAAWIHDGEIGLTVPPAVLNPLRSSTVLTAPEMKVKCFNLSAFVLSVPDPVILKMDCEGAEAVLVPHLIETGAIDNVELLLIEVHDGVVLPEIPCAWEEW